MNYRALQDEIMNGPKAVQCAPHVVTNAMPKDPDGYIKDKAIADILSAGRTKIGSTPIGDGAVALALGIPAGPVFLLNLETVANTQVTGSSTPAEIAQIATARQAWRALMANRLDVGDAQVRAAIDLFVGALLDAAQATAIKALAEQPETITAADVSRALRGPWE